MNDEIMTRARAYVDQVDELVSKLTEAQAGKAVADGVLDTLLTLMVYDPVTRTYIIREDAAARCGVDGILYRARK